MKVSFFYFSEKLKGFTEKFNMANKSWLYPMSQRFFGEKQNNDDDDKVEILDKQEVDSTKTPDEFEVFNNMVMKRNQLLQ